MPTGKMHTDELDTDVVLVRRLLAAQFPQWAELPITPVVSGGTVYALYRLGPELVARLPLRHKWIAEVEKEHYWLPRLATQLPLPIPVPLALGLPSEGYPLPWSVYRWLPGKDATAARIVESAQAARDLAHFISALRRIDPAGGPLAGQHNYFRGVPLAQRDAQTRAAITELANMAAGGLDHGLGASLDLDAAAAAWDASLNAPVWEGPPVWIHGDLVALNVLVRAGRLSAVIDWGGLGLGDPACDVMVAWRVLPAEAREIFRSAVGVDEATWARGRGWALSTALIALPYYHHTNPILAANARRSIDDVLADYMRGA